MRRAIVCLVCVFVLYGDDKSLAVGPPGSDCENDPHGCIAMGPQEDCDDGEVRVDTIHTIYTIYTIHTIYTIYVYTIRGFSYKVSSYDPNCQFVLATLLHWLPSCSC